MEFLNQWSIILTYIHTYINIHIYIHDYIYTYIHRVFYTYIHTYIRTCIQRCESIHLIYILLTYIQNTCTYIHIYMVFHLRQRAGCYQVGWLCRTELPPPPYTQPSSPRICRTGGLGSMRSSPPIDLIHTYIHTYIHIHTW